MEVIEFHTSLIYRRKQAHERVYFNTTTLHHILFYTLPHHLTHSNLPSLLRVIKGLGSKCDPSFGDNPAALLLLIGVSVIMFSTGLRGSGLCPIRTRLFGDSDPFVIIKCYTQNMYANEINSKYFNRINQGD